MLFLNFIFRHIQRHWGMNLSLLFVLSLGSALLGSLPSFAAMTATKSLRESLTNSLPAARNIQVVAAPEVLTSALNHQINESIGDYVTDRLSVSNTRIPANSSSPIINDQDNTNYDFNAVWVWSFDKLRQNTNLIRGRWPIVTYPQTQAEALQPPTIQAVISENVAEDYHLKIGDKIQDVNEYKYLITGIFARKNLEDDIWWQDDQPFIVNIEPGLNEDYKTLPVLVNPASLKTNFGFYSIEWRYILDLGTVDIYNAEQFEAILINLRNRITANQAKINTGLPDLIMEYRQNLATSRMIIYLLSSQAFLFVIFTLILMASLLVNHSQGEISSLSGRGASRNQIWLTFAIQTLMLASIAGLVLGPLITQLGLAAWGSISGDPILPKLPPETWQMSILGASIGWIAIVVAMIPATRRSMLDWQQSISRPSQTSGWQNTYIDFLLLFVGALLYWQLSDSGSFVMTRVRGTEFADPLLLIGPSLLLIALAMIFLRFFPQILRGLTYLIKTSRSVVLPISLIRIARNPTRVSWIILLVSVAAGLILFAKIYSEALDKSQEQIAKYEAGSNLRLDQKEITDSEIPQLLENFTVSPVLRGKLVDTNGRNITILAVDPDSFVKVAEYPQGMTNLTIDTIMQALKTPARPKKSFLSSTTSSSISGDDNSAKAIPGIVSYASLSRGEEIGDQFELLVTGNPITFEIIGTIADFPTLSSRYLVVNSETFKQVVGSSMTEQLRSHELWIATSNNEPKRIVSTAYQENAVLADAQKSLDLIRSNILTLGTVRAFGLNGLILAVLSLAGLILANYFSLRQRVYEFGIMQAFGLSRRQSNRLLISEGMLIIGLGLISGLILGFSLTRLMRPYLSLAVSRNLPGMVVYHVDVNWLSIFFVVAILIAAYSFATAIILYGLWKSESHRILRLTDE